MYSRYTAKFGRVRLQIIHAECFEFSNRQVGGNGTWENMNCQNLPEVKNLVRKHVDKHNILNMTDTGSVTKVK